MSERADSTSAAEAGGPVLRGSTVVPGLVLGAVHRKDVDLLRAAGERVPLDQIEEELNRFRHSLDRSRGQLADLKSRLAGKVAVDDARILDTHTALLRDSAFVSDVEHLVLEEQMRLEAAIAKVVADFDRIFRLVADERLRQSAVDLRDVGVRVLRNLETSVAGTPPPEGGYVLAARELSIVDMFDPGNEHVRGIVAEEGSMTSHAAVFARSMGIPTLTAVAGLLDAVAEGDFVILDATEGLLRVEPDDVVRAQYDETVADEPPAPVGDETPEWALRAARTRDGEEIEVAAGCGNLPEVELARRVGMGSIGLYRTELLFLVEPIAPSRDALAHHYASVLKAASGPVTFRLLSLDSSIGVKWLQGEREPNPALGRAGVRLLLANEPILRRQLQALLIASAVGEARLAVPFVTDCGELRRIREVLFDERVELRKQGETLGERLEVGVVIETPAAMLGIRDLASEADFLLLNLDALEMHLLAADRENPATATELFSLHPFVLRALAKAADVARSLDRPLQVFGPSTRRPVNLGPLVGAGLRRFCVPPSSLRGFLDAVRGLDARTAGRAARAMMRASSRAETLSLVGSYRHGAPRSGS